jgi:uncharacterized surface protein with fasciclin (FAS1) repeats
LVILLLCTEQGFSQSRKARKEQSSNSQNLIKIASGNPDLKTFVKVFRASGLVDSLNNAGNFTVFAPSEAAFDSLPDGAKEDLLKPENIDQLKAILRNHIVIGKITASDLSNGKNFTSIGGQELGISALGGKIMVGGAEVTKPDLTASNGVIHIVNQVIVPPSEATDADK